MQLKLFQILGKIFTVANTYILQNKAIDAKYLQLNWLSNVKSISKTFKTIQYLIGKRKQYQNTFVTAKRFHNCLGENLKYWSFHVIVYKRFSLNYLIQSDFCNKTRQLLKIKERSKVVCITCLRQPNFSSEFYNLFYNRLHEIK